MSTQSWIIGGAVVVVIAVAAWMFFNGQPANAPTTQEIDETVDVEGNDVTLPGAEETVLNTEEAVAQDTATLEAVGNYSGSGTATRSWNGATFTHTITATISDPAAGKFYEGWLVDKTPTLRFFSTGRLTKQGNQYVLTYTATQDYPDHNDVVITEETSAQGLDGKPEAHVLEGSF